jgi:hypothetical protein
MAAPIVGANSKGIRRAWRSFQSVGNSQRRGEPAASAVHPTADTLLHRSERRYGPMLLKKGS